MAEQERHDFVRSIRHSLLDLARRIEHASSTDEVEYVIGRLRQISRHLLRLEGAEGLTEEVRNSLVTVSSMLSEVEQQQQQQSRQNIVAAEGSGCAGRPRLEITAEQLEYLFGYDLPRCCCGIGGIGKHCQEACSRARYFNKRWEIKHDRSSTG